MMRARSATNILGEGSLGAFIVDQLSALLAVHVNAPAATASDGQPVGMVWILAIEIETRRFKEARTRSTLSDTPHL
jgi:hypothetical protein